MPPRPALEATRCVGLSRGRGGVRVTDAAADAAADSFARTSRNAEEGWPGLPVPALELHRKWLVAPEFTSLSALGQPGPRGLDSYIPTSLMEVNP